MTAPCPNCGETMEADESVDHQDCTVYDCPTCGSQIVIHEEDEDDSGVDWDKPIDYEYWKYQ